MAMESSHFFHQQYLHILTLVSTCGIVHLHPWKKRYFITTVRILCFLKQRRLETLKNVDFFCFQKFWRFQSWRLFCMAIFQRLPETREHSLKLKITINHWHCLQKLHDSIWMLVMIPRHLS